MIDESKLITAKYHDENLIITVPLNILVLATENNPLIPNVVVKDRDRFADEVADQISSFFYDQETGLTEFQKFLDRVIEQVVVSESDSTDIEEL